MIGFTVLGGHGFIGSQLTHFIRGQGLPLWAPERGDPEIFSRPLGHVLYCVGVTSDFRERPFDVVEAHVSLLARVLSEARFDSFLYLSSTRVYRRSSSGHESATLALRPEEPEDLYNASKILGESLCLAQQRPRVRIARLSNVVGRDGRSANFLSALIKEARAGAIELRSSLDSAKDYVLIDDVVAILTRIATEGRERIYNVASGKNLTHREIVARLVELTGCRLTVLPGPRVLFPTIDIARVRGEFAFNPKPVPEDLPALVHALSVSDPPIAG